MCLFVVVVAVVVVLFVCLFFTSSLLCLFYSICAFYLLNLYCNIAQDARRLETGEDPAVVLIKMRVTAPHTKMVTETSSAGGLSVRMETPASSTVPLRPIAFRSFA